MNKIYYNSGNQSPRWLGYFDLLGTSELIRSRKTEEVLIAYKEALDHLTRLDKRYVYHAWFSDTFILYSEDDSAVAFSTIEQTCRWFAFALLIRGIALRGALACGEFYADRTNSLYLGAAFLEAYECGENQDWIGFILCPSSVERLDVLKLPIKERLNYVEYPVPFKRPQYQEAKVGVCILGNWIFSSDGSNTLLPKLQQMNASQTDPLIRRKYERTIEFLIKHESRPTEEREQAKLTPR
jgi:hypothetical protein